jgi:hypothetical protein
MISPEQKFYLIESNKTLTILTQSELFLGITHGELGGIVIIPHIRKQIRILIESLQNGEDHENNGKICIICTYSV